MGIPHTHTASGHADLAVAMVTAVFATQFKEELEETLVYTEVILHEYGVFF